MKHIQEWAQRMTGNMSRVIFGKDETIRQVLAALLARGHILLDDVPGLGKTMLARSLAQSLGIKVSRIQSTPDLMPTDVLGVSVYNPVDGSFKYRKGPLINNFVLVDEVNRATPRTQSALLEAMAEQQVSIEGKSLALPQPFFLMATQNPVDFEGTFPLPEAQKDRFLITLQMGYPDKDTERSILKAHTAMASPLDTLGSVSSMEELKTLQADCTGVYVADAISDYIIALGEATRQNTHLRMGISPRGSLALYQISQAMAAISGRDFVIPEDVKALMLPVFIGRIILKPSALVKGLEAAEILRSILDEVPAPLMSEVQRS